MKKSISGIMGLTALCLFALVIVTGCEPENTVYEGDYYIESIADLKALSGYTEITGNLFIGRYNLAIYFENMEIISGESSKIDDFLRAVTPLKNLDGLESLTTIGGSLYFGYAGFMDIPMTFPSLENIDGLCNLTSVGGRIFFYHCRNLKNLDGFKNLKTVGGSFSVGCYSLTSLDALSNLTSVGGSLNLEGQLLLTDMTGLANLTSVGGLVISDNKQLTSLEGMDKLASVGYLRVSYNDSLESIEALKGILETDSDIGINIVSNPVLKNISPLADLITADSVVFQNNPALTAIELDQLTSCSSLTIAENSSLVTIDGLNNLTSISERHLVIQDNEALQSITGFNSLTSIKNTLAIRSNPVLETISGFNALEEITGISSNWSLSIYGNPAMSDLDFLDGVAITTGNILICGNGEAADNQRETLKDRLIAEGWDGCWDFTCDAYPNAVCQETE